MELAQLLAAWRRRSSCEEPTRGFLGALHYKLGLGASQEVLVERLGGGVAASMPTRAWAKPCGNQATSVAGGPRCSSTALALFARVILVNVTLRRLQAGETPNPTVWEVPMRHSKPFQHIQACE
eukprot:scaffold1938_cov399-Prasinococcus_capsulatus_cf.AAC.10